MIIISLILNVFSTGTSTSVFKQTAIVRNKLIYDIVHFTLRFFTFD